MAYPSDRQSDEGLSARHLVMLFLAGVAVCAVFFSLGFLVGYNERGSKLPPVETVNENPAPPPATDTRSESSRSGEGNAEKGVAPSAAVSEVKRAESAESAAAQPAAPDKSQESSRQTPEPQNTALSPSAARSAADALASGFNVQVAALRTTQDAEALAQVLRTHGYKVFVAPAQDLHANDNLVRVEVGPFASRDQAEKARQQLQQEGFKPFIRH